MDPAPLGKGPQWKQYDKFKRGRFIKFIKEISSKLGRPKRGSHQAKKIKTKWKASMKTNEKMMNMTRILAQNSMMEVVEKSSNAWI